MQIFRHFYLFAVRSLVMMSEDTKHSCSSHCFITTFLNILMITAATLNVGLSCEHNIVGTKNFAALFSGRGL